MNPTFVQTVIDKQGELMRIFNQEVRAGSVKDVMDGVPMAPDMAAFYKAIKRIPAYRRVIPYIAPSGSSIRSDGVCRVALAMPEDVFIMAVIDYAPGAYGVISDTIKNDRYRKGTPDHYKLISSDMGRAVKNFTKNVRPMSPMVALSRMADNTCHLITASYNTSRKELGTKWEGIFGHSALKSELIQAYRSGYQFMDSGFRNLMDEMMQSYKEVNDSPLPATLDFVFIRFFGNGDVDITIPDTYKLYNGSVYRNNGSIFKGADCKSEAEVPEWLLNKVAALRMLSIHDYIPGLGVKRSEYAYLVERDINNEAI